MSKPFRDIILEIAEILKSGGIVNHFAEARALAATVLNRPVNRIHPAMDIELTDEQTACLFDLAKRRADGEPLQLISGCVGFFNSILHCEKNVFIPRIETETIVNRALYHLDEIPVDRSARILDLGTGTGAIIIALASEENRHQYYGIDKSEKAVNLARRNAETNQTQDRTFFYNGEYFDPVRGWDDVRFELVISNPPYIKTSDIEKLESQVREWDPLDALDGGLDGLDHYRRIATELPNFLATDGVALFEIAPEYIGALDNIFKVNGFSIGGVFKDFGGNDRVIEVVYG
jgi:release factor glutamine methyltransferase